MNRKIFQLLLGIAFLSLLYSCKNSDDDSGISEETLTTNNWIKENMETYYFWNDKLPSIDYTQENDPEAYFYKLLYTDVDNWSYMTDDYASLESELSGEPVSMGYAPAFYLVGSNTVIIVVKYVYPGSVAATAGLARGDIILSIDDTEMDTTNYYDLYSGTSYSVELGQLSGTTLSYTGESLSMTARTLEADPAICHKIFNINGYKIGYLAYVEFVAGDNNQYLNTLDDIFDEFKSEGISDLIVDLRYNPGGDGDAAVHLASEIAPSDVVSNQEVLVNFEYNTDLENYLTANHLTDYLYYNFSSVVSNVDMERVYFLTTSGSASASELVISGLAPYMDVEQIGEATYGKYAGMWVIPDDNEEWAIVPIVMKYANADGYTDFVDGLQSDYEIEDDLFTALPLGDSLDPMTAKAIELASGITINLKSTKSTAIRTFRQVVPHEIYLRRNLFISVPGKLRD